jgi:hypothetical protein
VYKGGSGVRVTVRSGDTVSVSSGVDVEDGKEVIEAIPVGDGVLVSVFVVGSAVRLCVAVGSAEVVGDGLTSGVKLGVGTGVSVGVGSTIEDAVAVGVSCIVEVAEGEGVSWNVGGRVNVPVNSGVGVQLLVTAKVGVEDAVEVNMGVLVGGPGLTFPGEGISETSQSPSVPVSTPIGYLARELPSGAASTGG